MATIRLLQDQNLSGYPFSAGDLVDIDVTESAWRVGGGLADDDAAAISRAVTEGEVVIDVARFVADKLAQKNSPITKSVSDSPNIYTGFDDPRLPTPEERGVGPIFIAGVEYWADGFGFIESKSSDYDQSLFAEIRARLYKSAKHGFTLNYILTGDSTRKLPKDGASIPHAPIYYAQHLSKFNTTVDLNSAEGLDSTEWRLNTFTEGLTQCLGFISGTGLNSIVEFSLGLNDSVIAGYDYALIETELIAALDALLAAKPDVAILLTAPTKTEDAARNEPLIPIYESLSAKYGLPLIDTYAITKMVSSDSNYYLDTVHPDEFGQKRFINKILEAIVPPVLRELLVFENMDNVDATAVVENGFFYMTGGVDSNFDADARRLEPIFVEHGAVTMLVSHQGNARSIYFMDKDGVFISNISLNSTVQPERDIYIPYNCREIRINVSSLGAAYDALNDSVAVAFSYMPLAEINKVLSFKPVLQL